MIRKKNKKQKTKEEKSPEVVKQTENPVYWAFKNTTTAFSNGLKSRRFRRIMICLVILAIACRSVWQPYAVVLRQYLPLILMMMMILILIWLVSKIKLPKLKKKQRLFVRFFFALPIFLKYSVMLSLILTLGGLPVGYGYIASYYKYQETQFVELDALPLTTKVTPQPLNSISVSAKKKLSDSESVQVPDRLMDKGEIRFSLEVTPLRDVEKWLPTTQIRKIFLVSAESPSPNFKDKEDICFPSGEGLFWNNSLKFVKKRLDPWKFFNYEPEGVRYIRNDEDKIIQVIPMTKYSGWFARPEFAGVYILEQCDERNWKDKVALPFIGEGEFISSDEMKKYPYLQNQNLVPAKVHRSIASSMKFQNGFLGPIPGGPHRGDTRIPDIAGDLNPQPFTQYMDQLNMVNQDSGLNGLFAYFCLEPFIETRSGLSISMFVPGDGNDEVYYYHHTNKGELLTGCSTIGDTIADSKKEYNWAGASNVLTSDSDRKASEDPQSDQYVDESHRRKAAVVEHRPHIRDIAGQRRFYFLSTVVTLTQNGNFAGGEPELVITDPQYDRVVWVDPTGSIEKWDTQIEEAFARTYESESR